MKCLKKQKAFHDKIDIKYRNIYFLSNLGSCIWDRLKISKANLRHAAIFPSVFGPSSSLSKVILCITEL